MSAVGMTEFMGLLLGNKAKQWDKDNYPLIKEAVVYVKEIRLVMSYILPNI